METPVITMILHAGLAARVVLVILLIFSVMTWTIIFNRFHFMRSAARGNRRFRKQFEVYERLADVEKIDNKALSAPVGRLARVGLAEYRRIVDDAGQLEAGRDSSFLLQNQFSIA